MQYWGWSCFILLLGVLVVQATNKEISLLTGDGGVDCTGRIGNTFPNIGYMCRGYNALRGNPLSEGHDPGFMMPIFKAKYSGGMSEDCRYLTPDGFVITPDVSCTTSFESKDVSSMEDVAKEMSASASINGGAYGVSFSASAGYREASQEMSGGNYVYIMSSASCTYYYTTLLEFKPPKFTDLFEQWVKKLDGTGTTHINDFIDQFGTHYVSNGALGARFNKQHRMSAKNFTTSKTTGFNLEMAASYSGAVSIGAKVGMDQSQTDMASKFSKMVRTTTSSIGATPSSDGDANSWAAAVKSDPLPTKYELNSIENLFTAKYMSDLGVDYTTIAKSIVSNQAAYCKHVQSLTDNTTSCSLTTPDVVEISNLQLLEATKQSTLGRSNCRKKCQSTSTCMAATLTADSCYHLSHTSSAANCKRTGTLPILGTKTELVLSNIKASDYGVFLPKTEVIGTPMKEFAVTKGSECQTKCQATAKCIGFTYCSTCKTTQCWLYRKEFLHSLGYNLNKVSVLIGKNSYVDCTDQSVVSTSKISVSNGGVAKYGTWLGNVYCPDGSYGAGIRTKSQPYQGSGDDEAMTELEMACKETGNDKVVETENAYKHGPGQWSTYEYCPQDWYIVAFKAKVEAYVKNADNALLSKVIVRCRSPQGETKDLPESGLTGWGTWGEWSNECPLGEYFCYITVSYNDATARGRINDSNKMGLAAFNFKCCKY